MSLKNRNVSFFFYSCNTISGIVMTSFTENGILPYLSLGWSTQQRMYTLLVIASIYRRCCWALRSAREATHCCVCVMKRDCSAARISNFLELYIRMFTLLCRCRLPTVQLLIRDPGRARLLLIVLRSIYDLSLVEIWVEPAVPSAWETAIVPIRPRVAEVWGVDTEYVRGIFLEEGASDRSGACRKNIANDVLEATLPSWSTGEMPFSVGSHERPHYICTINSIAAVK